MVRNTLLLILLGLVLGIGCAEVLARAFRRGGCAGGNAPLWQPARDVGWAHIPGARAEVPVCGGEREIARHAITINALGQRDRPRQLARTGGVGRVLVLGDSFVEAMQVELDESFPALLEHRLGIEMLNAGVSGYSADNELRMFTSRGRRYRPDAVLLVVQVANDVLDCGSRLYLENLHGLLPKPWLRARDASPGLTLCVRTHRAAARVAAASPPFLWNHSRALRATLAQGIPTLLRAACRGAADVPRDIPPLLGVYRPPTDAAWLEAWATLEDALRDLARRVRHTGARLGVAIAPGGAEYDLALRAWLLRAAPRDRQDDWDFDYPFRRLTETLARESVPTISLLPALRDHFAATGRTGAYGGDGHWSAEGHAVVARALATFVSELVARPRPQEPAKLPR